ncbi:MAG: hypothetical protein KF807_04500 [Xanthobacteraceae bacterium]|nr:hypothetical protein [Xanthobacteraceae bacterium]
MSKRREITRDRGWFAMLFVIAIAVFGAVLVGPLKPFIRQVGNSVFGRAQIETSFSELNNEQLPKIVGNLRIEKVVLEGETARVKYTILNASKNTDLSAIRKNLEGQKIKSCKLLADPSRTIRQVSHDFYTPFSEFLFSVSVTSGDCTKPK